MYLGNFSFLLLLFAIFIGSFAFVPRSLCSCFVCVSKIVVNYFLSGTIVFLLNSFLAIVSYLPPAIQSNANPWHCASSGIWATSLSLESNSFLVLFSHLFWCQTSYCWFNLALSRDFWDTLPIIRMWDFPSSSKSQVLPSTPFNLQCSL